RDATKLTFTYGECSGTDLLIPEIFAIDTAGKIRSQLTNNSVADAFSDWSPTGSSIAFTRGNSGNCSSSDFTADIYTMDAEGGNERRLTSNGGFTPVYSPDGSKIAFVRETSDDVHSLFFRAIYVM